ncbi:MAG: immunoglobulin domain-containing protein [bacterium]
MKIINLIILLLLFTSSIFAQQNVRSINKKLIHVGHEMPSPQFLKDSLAIIESQPFEGVVIRLNIANHGLGVAGLSPQRFLLSDLQAQLDILKSIRFNKLTDNFIWVMADNGNVNINSQVDWFNDSQWDNITRNMKVISKFVKESGIKGIFWDPENYMGPSHPWTVSDKYPGKSYFEIGKKVRQRGKEWIQALQSEKADIKVLSLFYYSISTKDSNDALYPLNRFFNDGILEGLNDEAKVIDGNEHNYWAKLTLDFPMLTTYIKNDIPRYYFYSQDKNLSEIYRKKITSSAGVYTNMLLGVDIPTYGEFYDSNIDTSTRAKFLEHNVYQALLNNDEYVWLWNESYYPAGSTYEGINWWRDFLYKDIATKAISSAKNKIKNHERLGYTLDNRDPELINAKGFHIYESDTILDLNTSDNKRSYHKGEPIRVNLWCNDSLASNFRCYVNGVSISSEYFLKPFNINFDTLETGIYDIYALGYTYNIKTNKYALIQSNYITIEVKPKVNIFKIANHTKELISCVGSEDNFIVCAAEASSGFEAKYQWYKDGIELVGKNSPILKFSYFDYPTSGIYKCRVTAEGFSKVLWSGEIPVYALSLPEITDQPKEVINAQIGGNYSFEVKVHYRGKVPPYFKDSFQWYRLVSGSNEPTALVDNGKFGGTTSSILTINGLSADDICQKAEYYIVEIVSQCGSVRSNPFIISQKPEVVFSLDPKDTEVCPGSDVVLEAQAIAPQGYNVTYSWKKDNTPITDNDKYNGTNTSKLQIYDTKYDDDAGYYQCEAAISSEGIYVEGVPAMLLIKAIPTAEPINGIREYTIKRGNDASFKVDFKWGAEPVTIKWTFNGEVIKEGVWDKFNGDKLLTLSLESINENQAGDYICSLENECAKTEIKFNLTVTKWDEAGIADVVSENGYSLYTAIPNPTKELVTIKYIMPKSGIVKFTLSDISGRVIRNLFEGNANEGINSLQINVKQLGLPAGVYFYTMTSDGFSGVRSFVVE